MSFPTEASVGGGVSRGRILVTVMARVLPEKLWYVTFTQNLCVCPMVLIRASGTGTTWSDPSLLLALRSSIIMSVSEYQQKREKNHLRLQTDAQLPQSSC